MKTIQISDKGWENLENIKYLTTLASDDFISDILENVKLITLFRVSMLMDEYNYVIGMKRKTFEKIRKLARFFGKSVEEFIDDFFSEQSPMSIMDR